MALAAAWTQGTEGTMAPIEQAKLWGLREALRKMGEDTTQYAWMASQVRVVGGGHPSRQAVDKFFARVDADTEWHPGKRGAVGRPKELTAQKRDAIARTAMRLKRSGQEPSYEAVVSAAPAATRNDTTAEPFSRQTINDVFTTDCYDHNPEKPWEFRWARRRRPLTAEQMLERVQWGSRLLRAGLTGAWVVHNIIWADISSKVIPGAPRKAYEQAAAGASKRRRLMSSDATQASANLAGSATAEKQCSSGDTRVFFFVVVTRGVLGVTVFSDVDAFPGETQAGAAMCVERLPRLLQRMLGRDTPKPRTLFTDRGPGFYNRNYGTITGDYEGACRKHGFRTWAGTNALTGPRRQPGDIADVLPHETVTAWLRERLVKSAAALKKPWEETPEDFAQRMDEAVRSINSTCDVRGACAGFPERLRKLRLVKPAGDRLRT